MKKLFCLLSLLVSFQNLLASDSFLPDSIKNSLLVSDSSNWLQSVERLSPIIQNLPVQDHDRFFYEVIHILKDQPLRYRMLVVVFQAQELFYLKYNRQDEQLEILIAYKENAEFQSPEIIKIITYNIGLLYYRMGDNQKAEAAFRETVESPFTEWGDIIQISALNTLALIKQRNKDYPDAVVYYNKTLELAKKYNNLAWVGISYLNLGGLYKESGDSKLAETNYRASIRFSLLGKHFSGAASAFESLSEMALSKKEVLKARSLLDSAFYLMETFEKRDRYSFVWRDVYLIASKIDSARGNYHQAFLNYLKFAEMADTLEERTNRMELLRMANNLAYHKQQADLIKLTAEMKEKDKEQSNLRIILFSGLVFTLILGFVLYKLHRKNRLLKLKTTLIEAQQDELLSVNAAKDKLFSIIAHDLRGPVSGIQQGLELVNENDMTEEERFAYLTTLQQSVAQVYNTLDNLLIWVNQQFTDPGSHAVVVWIPDLIGELLSLYSRLLSDKNISVETQLDDSHLVYADENELRVILRNLISNAIKFSQPGGIVRIQTRIEGEWLIATISDSGIGMSEVQIRNLFRKDKIESRFGTKNEKGVGLGFKLCLEFAKKNGGELLVESKPGEGSQFSLKLKRANQ
ncbi:MAG: tetratricopeptide repeat-containing sensor histidine kinase [Bacteroidetes bacterium]|nr:tetratricopeptide repeat-containing sensor histidine kinase [Bacteroidota bacterium]